MLADALVSLGVVIAGVVISYTDIYWLDPAIGLVILLVILLSTWSLLRDSFKMTIDAVPSGIELEEIKEIIKEVPHVRHVQHVHVWSLSTSENALTAHIVFDEELSFDQMLKVIKEVKGALQHNNIQHCTIEISKNTD